MKKLIILFAGLFCLAISNPTHAQCEGEFEKLHIMYVDGTNYKLLDKATKMSTNDKYSREPLVYLYMAIAYYEISKDPERDMEEFKDPFKSSVKYAAKFKKKDKKRIYYNCEASFWEEIKGVCNEDIRNGYLGIEESYDGTDKAAKANLKQLKKGYKRAKEYSKFAPEQTGVWFAKAVGEDVLGKSKDKDISLAEGKAQLDSVDFSTFEDLDLDMLKIGVIIYAKYVSRKGDKAEAKAVMNKIEPYFKEDEEYKEAYEYLFGK